MNASTPRWERVWSLRDFARLRSASIPAEAVAELARQPHVKVLPRREVEPREPVTVRYEAVDLRDDVVYRAVRDVEDERAAVDVKCDCHKDSLTGRAQVLGTPEADERTVGDAADTATADSPVDVLGRPAGVPVVALPIADRGDGHTSIDVAAEALAYVADGDQLTLERRYWLNDVPMRDRVMLSPEGEVTWL